MAIKHELVDELLKDADPKQVFSSEGLLGETKKALAERMLNAPSTNVVSPASTRRSSRCTHAA